MSDRTIIESGSVEQTLALGAAVGRLCRAGDVIALVGELGAGKTQFVRGLAEGMGLNPRQVSSPTFVIAQEYASDDESRVLVHIDAYRLQSADEFVALGWAGTGGDLPDGAVLAVEWADRVTDALGDDRLEVHLAHRFDPDAATASAGGPGERREISLTPFGDWIARIISLT